MKGQLTLNPFGRLSIRNVVLFVAMLVATVFSYVILASPTVHAADEATWKNGELTYQNKVFNPYDAITEGSSSGLPAGTKVFIYTPPGGFGQTVRIEMIYFGKNENPKTATAATYITYVQTPPDKYSDPKDKKAIQLVAMSKEDREDTTTSCIVDGIGWIICPVTNFLSKAMDWLFDVMSSFLTVRPVQTDQESVLYRGWSMMRNIANVAFVIAFLIVIYSQVTNIGLSSYGIKRMLPRLIAAAILVNVSYWICAIAVDLSNIAGYSIYDLFDGMRKNLIDENAKEAISFNWQQLTTFLLSGGTAAAAVGFAAFAGVAAAGGPIFMLIPILVGVVISALIALLIMAARQALITILVIVAPLAFVAYLLPNTEKYFDKWKGLFGTMLALFPMFAAVVGGAQLAGDAIIQNAMTTDGPNSLNLIILGMGVKDAPVAATPFLLKFSGSLLGKIAGIVNNPGKGLIDRTRNFAQERADNFTAKQLANTKNPGLLARGAQRIDANKRKREGWRKSHQASRDAAWANSQAYSDLHAYDANTNKIKEIGENRANARVAAMQSGGNATAQDLDIRARASKLELDVSQAKVDANWEELKAGDSTRMITASQLSLTALSQHANQARQTSLEGAIEARRTHSAKEVQQDHVTNSLIHSEVLQRQAGGIAEHGADAALADAVKQNRKSYMDAVADASQLMKHFNLDSGQRQDVAYGRSVDAKDANGNIVKTFDATSLYMREAAIEAQMKGEGSFTQIQEIIADSGGTLKQFATTIGGEIAANRLSEKAAYLGGKTINDVKQGKIKSVVDLDIAVSRTIADGKIKPSHLATMDVDAVKKLFDVARAGNTTGLSIEHARDLADQITNLGVSAREALTNPSLKGSVASNVKPVLEDMINNWPPSNP